MIDEIKIKDVKVSAYKIPTDGPESDGTIEWNSTTLILVEIEGGGKSGIGYTYADVTSALFIDKSLKKILIGKDGMQIPFILKTMVDSVRNNNNCGVIAMAISAIDSALWDLKAKILNLPLVSFLGKQRNDPSTLRKRWFHFLLR